MSFPVLMPKIQGSGVHWFEIKGQKGLPLFPAREGMVRVIFFRPSCAQPKKISFDDKLI
jgi:hypothetical protein